VRRNSFPAGKAGLKWNPATVPPVSTRRSTPCQRQTEELLRGQNSIRFQDQKIIRPAMKTPTGRKFAVWSLVLALAAGTGLALRGSEKTTSKPVERPPLKLQTDAKPINRDAAERVSFANIVKKTAPSVVYVFSTKTVKGQDMSQFFNDPMFRRFFGIPGPGDDGSNGNGGGRGGGRGRGGRAPDQKQQSLGSGIIISSDGYILTNNHVVDGADEVKVAVGESRKEYKATVVGRDPTADVAVLKIDATGLSPATIGDSEQLEVGDVVLAIGDPFGIGQSVSRGIVSALSRGNLGIEDIEDFIQTDAAINPGNSGGALIDTDGRVVGLNTAILSRSGGFNGVGFAIPINLVRSIAEQLVATGQVNRAFLGVQTQPMTEELSAMLKVSQGALIAEVKPDTPADKAGLKDGDIITKVDGTEIKDGRHLQLTVSHLAPGTEATIEYVRDGKTATVKAKLTRRPDDQLAAGGQEGGKDEGVLNGVGVGDITAQVRDELNLPRRIQGVVITSVDPDSASARAGLKEGDVITELNRTAIHNAEEAVKLSFDIKGPKVLVRLWRDGQSSYLVVDESK
jgi:serine protease Do